MHGLDNTEAEQELSALLPLIRQDQLAAVRRNVRDAAPVNVLVGAIALFVSVRYQHARLGIEWFSAVVLVNAIRVGQCFLPVPRPMASNPLSSLRAVQRQLGYFCVTALSSGSVLALLAFLCAGYTHAPTLFYLTVICGITAGAITHGAPYARMPSCFILPPLLSVFGCLLYAGGFERDCLAATVLIYIVALIRFAWKSETEFRETSRLKHQAVSLVGSLERAHSQALVVAKHMSYRATHDELTDLLNRAGFLKQVEQRLSGEQSTVCLMLLDLDGFKSVNNAFGHNAGDRVLVEVARRLSETLDGAFTIGRLGGDEFGIFYEPSVAGAFPAELATRLIASIAVPFASFDAGRLGACIGLYIGAERNVTELLTRADEALHAAKEAGRNQFYIFDDILRDRLEMRRDIKRDLQRALADAAPEVWYQPILGYDGQKLVSLEALLRWRHPQYGLVPPQEVIETAAMAGLAEPLLRYILADVCAMIQELRARGLGHVRVAMNISPREISRLAVDEILLAELRKHNCPTSMLEVEITEETVLDIRSVQDKLIRLSRGGVHITIDDFGVGYSTMATLRQPYVKKIKIDRSFVKDISISRGNQILVQSILNLGQSLGLQVVAEGVETKEDRDLLRRIGCGLMQGYFFRKPAPRETVLAWLPLSLS
ncbi:MAG TPA: EAL domain-containing protein [Acidocella sp.]|nr:EAL domain-containing protein [Acidocella sp.]